MTSSMFAWKKNLLKSKDHNYHLPIIPIHLGKYLFYSLNSIKIEISIVNIWSIFVFWYLRHIHGAARKRDFQRCFNQRNESRIRDRKTGLHDVNYVVSSIQILTIDKFPFSLFNVTLVCDRKFTPWCICPTSKSQNKKRNLNANHI